MFFESSEKRKAKKQQKAADKLDKKLDRMEESIAIRDGLLERGKEQRERAANLKYMDRHLTKADLRNSIADAKGELFVTRDQLYNIINRSAKEIIYLENQPATPGGAKRHKNLMARFKNALYALTLVEQILDRLNNIMSEHEWQQVIRDLTNGYKTVNAISTGSDWLTRFLFKIQKLKLNMKGMVSASSRENYFGKTIDERLAEEDASQAAVDMLVTAECQELVNLDKQSVFEAARNGVFVTMMPDEVVYEVGEAEKEMISKDISPEIGLEMDNQNITTEMSHMERVKMMDSFSG